MMQSISRNKRCIRKLKTIQKTQASSLRFLLITGAPVWHNNSWLLAQDKF